MFNIKKLSLINALTFIPRKTQDDPLRIAINLPKFHRIPQAGYISDYWPATLHFSTTQFVIVSLCCISLRHEINLLWLFFRRRFWCKAAKLPKKKKSLQRYRALSDNYMENKMFVSKTDRSKWPGRWEFDRSSPRSGRTLSVDRPLFPALVLLTIPKEELMGWHPSGDTKTRIRVIGVKISEFLVSGNEI